MVDLKSRLNDELLTKEKEVKKLHLQHKLERSQLEDIAHKQRRAFVKEKEHLRRELLKQFDVEMR